MGESKKRNKAVSKESPPPQPGAPGMGEEPKRDPTSASATEDRSG